ncbi:MAG: zinc ribbon domain-containing protein [Chloroflexi bacterium]|nr:zinc ribbon domain-containing protein [Chloroflexota bacterium]
MITCSTCGALNDPVNRFCDQCGSRLEPGGVAPQAPPPALNAQPTAAAPVCPSCGAMVLPGQAFCEECGTALAVAVQPASGDVPTMFAAAPDIAAVGPVCPACGHQNLPGDRFCDSCGASLAAAAMPAPPISDVPTAAAPGEPAMPPPEPFAAPPGEPAMPPPAFEQPLPTMIEAVAPVIEPPVAPPPVVEPPVAPVAAPPAVDAQAEYEARRQTLTGEIARQQQIIAQFEQMQAMFGAATPHAVAQGLAEARDALAKAEAELAALQPPPPPVDPAVVARLNDEIARQQQIIAQFEQMQAMFGAATPHAVAQGLAEARDALAKAEAELAALGVAAAPVAPPVAPAPAAPVVAPPVAPPVPPASVEPDDTAATVTSPPPDLLAASAPTILAPPVAPTGPRLVFDDGKHEIVLPMDKTEITVGREDPISGIHPEIDLTPFGGESGGVSRQHARLIQSGGHWAVVDLGSTNYTRVDGVRVEPGAPQPLKDGARVQFGRLAVTFKL